MDKFLGYIDVCYTEEPFIYNINGNFILEELINIETDLIQDEYDFNEKYKGKEKVRFAVHYVKNENYLDLTCVSVK